MQLCSEERDDLRTTISANLEKGELKLKGYDSGKVVGEFFGNSNGYEYFLSLDKDNTNKLFDKLGILDESDEQKLAIIKDKFNWKNGFSDFSDYCKKNNITTSFYSWQSGF